MAKYVDVIETGWQMRPLRICDIDVFPVFGGQLRSFLSVAFFRNYWSLRCQKLFYRAIKLFPGNIGWCQKKVGEWKMVEMRCLNGERESERRKGHQKWKKPGLENDAEKLLLTRRLGIERTRVKAALRNHPFIHSLLYWGDAPTNLMWSAWSMGDLTASISLD